MIEQVIHLFIFITLTIIFHVSFTADDCDGCDSSITLPKGL